MISYSELEERLGVPIGVEEARSRWGALVSAAGEGQVTLITRERWEWAALVPLSKVSGVLAGLPVVSLSTGKAKLGDLVRQVAEPYDDSPVLLARHRTPVAALIAATRLLSPRVGVQVARPGAGGADALLREGCTVTLSCHPTGSGVIAVARDRDGGEVAVGTGDTLEQALRALN
ncbi:hypothetical protein ACIA8R_28200 [Nonomuraea sp. NPDC051191]|uniref:hypothetical protein n=1 Tax=Nonomuraea sp. NPDC051191 TaxID=3364372 RepID=UPI0037A986AB